MNARLANIELTGQMRVGFARFFVYWNVRREREAKRREEREREREREGESIIMTGNSLFQVEHDKLVTFKTCTIVLNSARCKT